MAHSVVCHVVIVGVCLCLCVDSGIVLSPVRMQ